MKWPWVSRTAFEQVCQERDQWREFAREHLTDFKALVTRRREKVAERLRTSDPFIEPEKNVTPSLSEELTRMIDQVAERDPLLRRELTMKAHELLKADVPMDEIPEQLLTSFKVEV